MPSSTINGALVPIKVWAPVHELDSLVINQLKRVAALPWVAHHVAAMPDVHLGRGATVGSVVAMRGAVAPAAVGVDIGFGMAALKTNLRADQLPESLRKLRLAIEDEIPVGKNAHRHAVWEEDPELRSVGKSLMEGYKALAFIPHGLTERTATQLGTLGGGNHFVEVCIDTEDGVWLMLHSGSRHIGNALATHHMQVAAHLRHNEALGDPDLAVFLAGSKAFEDYLHDLKWAQEYARANRQMMLTLLSRVLKQFFPRMEILRTISCHHNYVAEEVHFGESLLVTRKGAIRAGSGELGIIPGSMGTRSFIVRGLGNPHAFESASHGAGRRMSRGEARRRYTVADLREQTEGVECRKDAHVLDEAPQAYKRIDQVMAQQADLAEIVAELKQVVCVKG